MSRTLGTLIHRPLRPAFTLVMLASLSLGGCFGDNDDGGTTPPPQPRGEPLTTQPGTPIGASATGTIGLNGGSLTSADGRLQLTVPAGAVAADTVFTITPITNPAANAVATYRLEPEGLTFTLPVTLTFNAPEAGTTRISIEGMGIAYHDAEGHWQWLDVTRDADGKKLSVAIEHFSIYSMIEGYVLNPSSAEIQVGESVQLQVMSCKAPDMGDHPLAPLVYECHALGDLEAAISNWSVNDVPGGNDSVGTVSPGANSTATFTAPAQQPDPSTSAVTVEVVEVGHPQLMRLFSLITIGQQGYHGQFTVSVVQTAPVDWTATGEATWTLAENGEYTVTASVTPDQTQFVLGDITCTLTDTTKTIESLGQIRDWTDPPATYWVLPLTIWSANCDGEIVNNFLVLNWASGCPGQGEWASLDASYPEHLKGTYTFKGCPAIATSSTTVTWDFLRQQ